ncbi:MAG TPA: BON domain-containing protein [Steroidobacter sp.]|uniref:BON domain-containing protein n=1 Tax=Steroidobacter sp. TaxID=1978227 RepID=UPI002ED8AB04
MRHLRELAFIVCLFCVVEVAAAQPAGQAVEDSVLTTKVKAALAGDRAVKARDIEVETRDGVVQLSGFVDSEDARTAAVMRARSVDGVAEVRNDLSIRTDDRPAQEPASDTVIAARVRDKLGNVKLADGSDVNVEVSEGVVQLSGFVMTDEEKVQAGDAASQVEGVRDVENHIALLDEEQRARER